MIYHQMMCLFGASGTFYPLPEAIHANGWGTTTTALDSVFVGGGAAVIRALLISNPASGTPTVDLYNGNGDKVMSWTGHTTVTQSVLCGPDGFKVPEGFYIVTSAAAYLTVIYDQE